MKHKGWVVVALVILVLAIFRYAVLPPVVKTVINDKLRSQPGLTGSVESVSLHLVRGFVVLKGLKLETRQGPSVTAIEMPEAEGRIHWGPLLHRRIVADVAVERPVVDIVNRAPSREKTPPEQIEKEISEKTREQPPFRIDVITVRDGIVRYHELVKKPAYVIEVTGLNAEVRNLSNIRQVNERLFATFDADALLMGSGRVHLTGKFNPVRVPPEFKLNLALHDLQLQSLDPMLKTEEHLRIQHGNLSLASEVATKNDRVDGYVKPAITDLQVSNFKKDIRKGLGHALKEQALNLAGQVAKNPGKDEQATRIPFHGRLDDPKAGIWPAIGATLRNMFVKAIVPNVEHSITIAQAGQGGKKG